MRYWTAEDIFDVECPYCDAEIEFWKDEPVRLCSKCGVEVRNPRIDLGCAKWCKFAEECLGKNVEHLTVAAPIIEHLRADISKALADEPERLAFAEEVHTLADTLGAVDHEADPRIVKCAALLLGASLDGQGLPEQAGLDPEAADHVRQTIRDAQGTPGKDARETRIVHDALVIAQAQHTASPAAVEQIVAGLTLDHARLLARHRFG